MANQMYTAGKNAFLKGQIAWISDTNIKATLIDVDYTYSQAHTSLVSVPAGSRVATATLGTKTVSAGACGAANTTFTAVSNGSQNIQGILIWKDVDGSDANAIPIAYIDTATNLPVLANGGNITVQWAAGVIFTL